ncbi:hypothetical protein TSAR_003115 [Trichomalopsis sarcophagae]|uniref:Uncharacterized protein n=1 Tax=Trichomalopsis sarcophagae TaxID=543379 RepID=A0A232FMM1_9HYME|nr:hypothetical protein TSAR_003115 [Trichomalopsis sarcophagae]
MHRSSSSVTVHRVTQRREAVFPISSLASGHFIRRSNWYLRNSFYKQVLALWKDTSDEEEMMILKQHADFGFKTLKIYIITSSTIYQVIPILSGKYATIAYVEKSTKFIHITICSWFRLIRLSKIAGEVKYGLNTLKDTDNIVLTSISRIVDLHNATLNNIKYIDHAFGTTYFIILLFNSLLFGSSLVLINNNLGDTFCEWYKLSKRSINSLRIIMLKSSMQCEITAIGMFVLSLETFSKDKNFPHHAWKVVTLLEKGSGCWPFENQIKKMIIRLIHFVNMIMMLVMLGIRLWEEFERKNVKIVMENSVAMIMILCTMVKLIMSYFNERQRKRFYEQMFVHWKDTSDEEEIMILRQYATSGLKTIIRYTIPMLLTLMNYLMNPNITHYQKQLPFYAEYFVDQEKYFYQLYLLLYFMIGAALIVTFSHELTYFQSVQHIMASFKIIELRLSRLSKLVKSVDCSLGRFNDADQKIFTSICGAVDLHNATLNCKWYKLSKQSKRSISIMMLRSFGQCQITASGMFVISLETYGKARRNNVTEMLRDEIQSVSSEISGREKPARDETKIGNGMKLAWLDTGEAKSREKLNPLLEQLKRYCGDSSLAGCKYIAEGQRTWFERVMWILLHLVMVGTLGAIIYNVLDDFKHTPVVTVVDSDNYPSNLLDLPVDKVLDLLRELGYLYESSFDTEHKSTNELDRLLGKYFDGLYDVTDVMKELTPKCSDMLIKCRFRAEIANCSELFRFRKSQDGFCCVFNYAREMDDLERQGQKNPVHKAHKIESLGKVNGLSFLMEPFLDDYLFPILPVSGWKITIFSPSDYPDNTSGGVSDALISPQSENFLELNADSFFSEKAVHNVDIEQRKCIFHSDAAALYDSYTYSDCIVNCRRPITSPLESHGQSRKMLILQLNLHTNELLYIQASNIYYATAEKRTTKSCIANTRRVCNTSDIECLQRFKSKWWSVLPHDIARNGQESKVFDVISNASWSLRCKNCYPSCNDVRYYLRTSSVNLVRDELNTFLKDVNVANQSIVHIFFARYGTVRLKQDIAYYWYELLSNIGGICGVFIGFSLISAFEFVYFLVLSILALLKSRHPNENQDKTYPMRPIFWDELAPRGKTRNAHADRYSKRRVLAH